MNMLTIIININGSRDDEEQHYKGTDLMFTACGSMKFKYKNPISHKEFRFCVRSQYYPEPGMSWLFSLQTEVKDIYASYLTY